MRATFAQLAAAGLIEQDAAGKWSTEARGIYFEIPDEPEAQRAARELSNTMLVKYESLPSDWVRQIEPQLDVTWARAAGLFNARVELTPDELRRLQEDLERLLEPLTNRPAEDRPDRSGTGADHGVLPARGNDSPPLVRH